VFRRKIGVCLCRSLKSIKPSYFCLTAFYSAMNLPLLCLLAPRNAFDATCVASASLLVAEVLAYGRFSQVIYSIVERLAVDMVNVLFRPKTSAYRPSNPVRQATDPMNSANFIPIGI